MLKKITSIVLIALLLSSNITMADFNKDLEQYNHLLKEQGKEELEVELKIFKLQRNLVNDIEDNYNNIYKNIEKNIEDIKKIYTEDYISKTKVNSDILIETNETSNLIFPSIDINNKTEIGHLEISTENELYKGKQRDKLSMVGNIKGSIFNNTISSKFDISQVIEKGRSIFSFNKLFMSSDFQYNNNIKLLNPNLTEDEFNNITNELSNNLNNINKNIIKLKGKNIELIDNNIMNQSNYGNIITSSINDLKEAIKEDRINKIFTLLKEEKIFYVYSTSSKNEYSLFYNNKLANDINKLANKDILPIISYIDFKTIEKNKGNRIKELEDGSFQYVYLQKGDDKKTLENVLYLNFNETRIYTGLIKNNSGIVFLNKNVIQFKNDNVKGIITFSGGDIKSKIGITEGERVFSISTFIQENLTGLINELEIIENNNIIGSGKLMYIKNNEDNKRLLFNLDLSGHILDNPIINKNGNFNINGEYLFKNNFSGFELFINDTSLLPISISGYIKSYLNFTNKEVNIPQVDNIDYKYTNTNNFFNELLK